MQTFKEKVFRVVGAIPRGKMLTYKQVATRAGSPNASRAVGSVLKQNYDPKIPCHRVIRSDGAIGEYNRGLTAQAGRTLKLRKLRAEGAL